MKNGNPLLLIGTRKGAFLFHGDKERKNWKLDGPHFLGHQVHHLVLDPRDGKTLLAATKTGHLGPTVFRSTDFGKTWQEAGKPPAYPKTEGGKVVKHVFWLQPGHDTQKDVWFAGTSPQGLFKSEDGGQTWKGVEGFNTHPDLEKWTGGLKAETPDGPVLHSINVNPNNADHMLVGMSLGGIFETEDGGSTWKPLNKGVVAEFLPEKYPEYGQDPHCVLMHPKNPNRIYHQNHCGIYRLDKPGDTWERIGKNMPQEVGDIGFPIVLHPREVDTAWVFPMDGTEVWPRTSPGGKPAAYITRDGGKTWKRQGKNLPDKNAWFTVLRQSMTCDNLSPLGLYFGATCGEVWMSKDEGGSWKRVARHLPKIFSVEIGYPK